MTQDVNIAIIFGGPSQERGISLNSARSVSDHLSELATLSFFYVDHKLDVFAIHPDMLYANTTHDFDFRLSTLTQMQQLCHYQLQSKKAVALTTSAWLLALKTVDLVMPLIHGQYGEDGQLQSILDTHQIPYLGTHSSHCINLYHKNKANALLKSMQYPTLAMHTVTNVAHIREWFDGKRRDTVLKPVAGGSSLGVFFVDHADQAIQIYQKKRHLYPEGMLLEDRITGQEFTIVVIHDPQGNPIALLPSQIDCGKQGTLFDYRRKYLPSANTMWHTPAGFNEKTITRIRSQAQELFKAFRAQDMLRIDGWLLEDDTLLFTDFNPISGMEQNSFIFQQSYAVGMNHQQLLIRIINGALQRHNRPLLYLKSPESKRKIAILMGGDTAERQVSMMSGSNVWMKIKNHYDCKIFFIDTDACLWHIPSPFALRHTVEEVMTLCHRSTEQLKRDLQLALPIAEVFGIDEPMLLRRFFQPIPYQLDTWLNHVEQENYDMVFLATHGGFWEGGGLQAALQDRHIPFNGSTHQTAAICMDKWETGKVIDKLNIPGITSVPKITCHLQHIQACSSTQRRAFYTEQSAILGTQDCIIKPRTDGCSAGVVRITSPEDFDRYMDFLGHEHVDHLPAYTLGSRQHQAIELPKNCQDFLIEPFIQVDQLLIGDDQIIHQVLGQQSCFELTIVVMQDKDHGYHAYKPSITVANNDILSVEEKFQGGTGVNLSPPPEHLIDTQNINHIRQQVVRLAAALGIRDYCRMDMFYFPDSREIIIIEVNTLPALTPSTVLFQQALCQANPIKPQTWIKARIHTASQRLSCVHN